MPGLIVKDSLINPFHELADLKGPYVLGRETTCDLILPNPGVSRLHAIIEKLDNGFLLKDQSRNGTRVNQNFIREHWLKSQDHLQIGPFHLEFRMQRPPEIPIYQNVTHEVNSFELIGSSVVFQKTLEICQKAAQTDFPVLIQGETGTGKELLARYVHQLSSRRKNVLLSINCATLNSNLMESELFGHEKGAFTGACDRQRGIFESAEKGSLLLDEIGELPLPLQAKLLRVLEEKRIRRVGSGSDQSVDVRVIAATNRDLKREMIQGRFREDLFHRLNILTILVPPLRERKEDLLPLSYFLLEKAGFQRKIHPQALKTMENYSWPGNIRELRNCLYRAAILNAGEEILQKDLDLPSTFINEPKNFTPSVSLESLKESEEDLIRKHLELHKWNRIKTAKSLGISRSTLFLKMRKFGLLEH